MDHSGLPDSVTIDHYGLPYSVTMNHSGLPHIVLPWTIVVLPVECYHEP